MKNNIKFILPVLALGLMASSLAFAQDTTTTATTTSTITLNNCPCISRFIVERLLKSYEDRIKSFESNKINK